MKCQPFESTKAAGSEKMSAAIAADSKMFHLKASPVKEQVPFKPQCPPPQVTTVLFSPKSNTGGVHDKENSTVREQHDGTPGLEDSGYLSLQNSHVDGHHADEDNHFLERCMTTHREKTPSPNGSPSKCQGGACPGFLVPPFTHLDHPRGKMVSFSMSSTPLKQHSDPNLPILKFQQDVCAELSKSYKKNKKYDWSIVTKVAENHLLDRVIGGQMGVESVDVFASLLCRNMKNILTKILSLLGDMDLISCKRVSKTWMKIICEDSAALIRCQQAEQALKESRNSLSNRGRGLTRDVAVSRVVLSCMQSLGSSTSRTNPKAKRGSNPSQGSAASECSRFEQYVAAASSLKQHESLRPCRHCGSPAKHWADIRRATCTRPSCLFDFCTGCQEAYHGAAPCRTVKPRAQFPVSKVTLHTPGSARSKRSIRRL